MSLYLHLRTGPNPQWGLDPTPISVPRTKTLSSLLSTRDRTLYPNLPGTGRYRKRIPSIWQTKTNSLSLPLPLSPSLFLFVCVCSACECICIYVCVYVSLYMYTYIYKA